MNLKISNPQVQETKYGTYTPVKFFMVDNSMWRHDVYTSKQSGDTEGEHVITEGRFDLTPVFIEGQHGKYISDCYGCWTGHAHTVKHHDKHIK